MPKHNRCKVKICGTTSIHDARLAAQAKADYSGVLLDVAVSERSRNTEQAVEIANGSPIPTVLLLFNRGIEHIQASVQRIRPSALQLLGHELPEQVEELKRTVTCHIWKSIYLPAGSPKNVDIPAVRRDMRTYHDAGTDFFLFDSVDMSLDKPRYGGTGKTCDWNVAAELIETSPLPVFFAGGIRPENVKTAIETIQPYGIDLCSGVEAKKGIKDKRKLEQLMEQVGKAAPNA